MVKRMTWIERSQQALREWKCVTHQFNQFRTNTPRSQEYVAQGDVVVYLHGILAEGVALEHLGDAVDVEPSIPSLFMSYSRLNWTLDGLVDALDSFLEDHTGDGTRIYLVGHSLGGLIARRYVQTREDERISGIICMATPHQGTALSYFSLGWLRTLFLPGGKTVQELAAGEFLEHGVPMVCIAAEFDQVVFPRESAVGLAWADHYWIEGVGHNEMLYSPSLIRCLSAVLTRWTRS